MMPLLSIIICSTNPDILPENKANIDQTVGVEYQLVIIDNSKNDHSIFSAYNEGVKKSDGKYLCFVHNDVIFQSKDWGQKIIDIFQDKSVGMIGLAGTHFMPKTPSSWWDPEVISESIIQGYMCERQYVTKKIVFDKYRSLETDLAAIDGLFMCIPKKMFQLVKWDEISFSGFHMYDLDMSMQVIHAGYKIRMAWDILVEHTSNGVCNRSYNDSLRVFYSKWHDFLPVQQGVNLSDTEIDARTRIAYLKHNPWGQYSEPSLEFKIGFFILHPWTVLKSWALRIFKYIHEIVQRDK